MDHLVVASCVIIGMFGTLSAVDGLYFHLWKYKLHTRPESYIEHVTHTARAILFGPTVYLLYGANHGGPLLWTLIALLAVDLVFESWDLVSERDSRASIGGLSSAEYWCHVTMTTLRVAAITLMLAAKPAAAWAWSAPSVLETSYPSMTTLVTWGMLPGAIGMALLHIYLLRPKYRRGAAQPA